MSGLASGETIAGRAGGGTAGRSPERYLSPFGTNMRDTSPQMAPAR
jgi:hypothetical protein